MKPVPSGSASPWRQWVGQERTYALASQLHVEPAAAHRRLGIAVREHPPLGANIRCRPLTQLSGAVGRQPCLTVRSIRRAIVASEARPVAVTEGVEVTSVT